MSLSRNEKQLRDLLFSLMSEMADHPSAHRTIHDLYRDLASWRVRISRTLQATVSTRSKLTPTGAAHRHKLVEARCNMHAKVQETL